MNRNTFVILVLLLILLLLILLFWSPRQPSESEATFSGALIDVAGQPVAGAEVRVGETTTVTGEEGRFLIKGDWASTDRWVLDLRKPGFAPVSKVFDQGGDDLNITLVETTTQTVDPTAAIVVRDVRTSCVGSAAASVDWGAHALARFPQAIDAGGTQLSGRLPAEAQRALQHANRSPLCSSGFQVSIPANALVAASGQLVREPVQVEVSTVDLYSPDGMPGDYSVASGDGPAYMESFGAGTVAVRQGAQGLQLSGKARARLEIPVDQTQIDAGAEVPETIPMLRYDPKSGQWVGIGEFKLDSGRMVYVAEVAHLSEFNADVVKTNPACLRFNASGITGSFQLVTTAPTSSGGFRQVTHTVAPNAAQADPNLHAIHNLPPNQWVVLRAIRSGTPLGTWVVETGAAWGSTSAPPYPYTACGSTTFALSETVAAGTTVNGSGHRFGLLPKHVTFLVDTSGAAEDVYPIGGTDCGNPCLYLFSLFDTGANRVLIDNTMTSIHGLTLTPNPSWDVDVRINGMDALSGTLTAPFGQPGTSDGAEAHSGVLRVSPRAVTITEEEPRTDAAGYVAVNYMLAGTPAANKVLARIDYTNPVTKGPWTFGAAPFEVTAPDIEFYQPGASGIPTPNLTLFVEGFGSAGTASEGDTDQRHFLQNVTFTEGSNTVYDDQTPASPVRFMYDSATTFTVISQAMATTLGATPSSPNPAAGCSSSDTSNFVTLDSVRVVGMNASDQLASYLVNNAEVCVDVAGTVIDTHYPDPAGGAAKEVDAVIGANLFDQKELLWNGPMRTLGLLP
jgi:hypothetical protein